MMMRTHQWENPDIELVESTSGELTLSIDGHQAMQAWERDLMWTSADLLCEFGSKFVEAGLGLGISALRIANHRNVRKHVVVERYQRVIDLFQENNPVVPATLQIVHDDLFRYFETVEPATVDGIFFDPFLPAELENQKALWDEFMPIVLRTLRPGGAFIPFFATEPVLKWPFYHYFDNLIVRKHTFTAYGETSYTNGTMGVGYVQCFIKGE